MPSAFDDLFADTAVPALFAVHGRSVTRWPLGVEADAESVEALWEPEPTGDRQASIVGQKVTFEGHLTVAEGQDVDRRDSWVIDDDRYQTAAVGKPAGELRTLKLTRVEKSGTSRKTNRM